MTSCTMRTRWLHSPFRTAGITTALFAVAHAMFTSHVANVRLPPKVRKTPRSREVTFNYKCNCF